MKSGTILYKNLPYKMGQDFLDIQYVYTCWQWHTEVRLGILIPNQFDDSIMRGSLRLAWLWVEPSDVDPDGYRIQRYEMKGKAEFNQQMFGGIFP